eukprot:6422792-Pyramimonas_sp.AAC.1
MAITKQNQHIQWVGARVKTFHEANLRKMTALTTFIADAKAKAVMKAKPKQQGVMAKGVVKAMVKVAAPLPPPVPIPKHAIVPAGPKHRGRPPKHQPKAKAFKAQGLGEPPPPKFAPYVPPDRRLPDEIPPPVHRSAEGRVIQPTAPSVIPLFDR